MFNWVCPRCGHEVSPSKTECPFCSPPAPESSQAQPPAQQYPPQPPPPPSPPPQYAQQPPPQYWQPQPPPPPYGQPVPPQYGQQAPPQYWQPQQPQYQPPPQYPPQPPYQPQEPQQYQPPPPPAQEPPPPAHHYTPAPAPERAPTPWSAPEKHSGRPTWLIALLAFAGVLAIFGIAYLVMGSHRSSAVKDDAKQQTTSPLQKYIEVVGVRIVAGKGGQVVKFLVVNHSGVELTDLSANVTLWASTQRSEEDSVGSFTFHADSIGANDSKELTAPLKSDKPSYEVPEDWRNISAEVQVMAPQQ